MTLLRKISLDEFLRLRRLVYRNARPLDYTKWKFLFENGNCVLGTTLSAITGTPIHLPIQYALHWIIWIRQVIMKAA